MKAVYSFLFVGFTTAALIQYDFDCFPIASKAKCILILIIVAVFLLNIQRSKVILCMPNEHFGGFPHLPALHLIKCKLNVSL